MASGYEGVSGAAEVDASGGSVEDEGAFGQEDGMGRVGEVVGLDGAVTSAGEEDGAVAVPGRNAVGLVSGDGVETETMLISEEIAMSPGGQEELSSEEADAVDLVGEAWGSVMAEEGGLITPEVVPGQAGVVPVLGDDAVEVVFGEAVAVLDAAGRMAMGQPDVGQGGEVEDAGDARAARDEREASVL